MHFYLLLVNIILCEHNSHSIKQGRQRALDGTPSIQDHMHKAHSIEHSSSSPQRCKPPLRVSILMSLLSFTTPSSPQYKALHPPHL